MRQYQLHDDNIQTIYNEHRERFYIELKLSTSRMMMIETKIKLNIDFIFYFWFRRYADLLARIEEYTRLFIRNHNTTGHVIVSSFCSKNDLVRFLVSRRSFYHSIQHRQSSISIVVQSLHDTILHCKHYYHPTMMIMIIIIIIITALIIVDRINQVWIAFDRSLFHWTV